MAARQVIQQFIDTNTKKYSLNNRHNFENNNNNKGNKGNNDNDGTIIFPLIQMGSFGITQDYDAMKTLLENISMSKSDCINTNDQNDSNRVSESCGIGKPCWHVTVASGYFNFPNSYQSLVIQSEADYNILTASPPANSFFESKGASYWVYIYIK